jgi:hypothetical protein
LRVFGTLWPDVGAQNSKPNSKRVVGKPFQKGRSGNPGGRPKGVGEEIRRRLGDKGVKLIELHEAVAFANAEWLAAHDFEVPSNEERLKAANWLTVRGYGKEPQTIEMSGPNGGPVNAIQYVIVDAGQP